MAAAAAADCEPSLQNILEQTSLKWVFVGGKGGVGKTTVSCCLALQLSQVRDKVLLVSTDPAHSLTDAWGQTFGTTPQLVDGFTNLYAMELDIDSTEKEPKLQEDPMWKELTEEIASALPIAAGFPGIHELLGFGNLWRLFDSLEYSIVVFDTAPTGHALRFIGTPFLLEESFRSLKPIYQLLRLLISMVDRRQGAENRREEPEDRPVFETLHEITSCLRDPTKTTFVGVCIAEFLSLYETERLIQRLTVYGVHTNNLVVNQLHPSPSSSSSSSSFSSLTQEADEEPQSSSCPLCSSRRQMQLKYLKQIESLYQDIHVTRLPLLEEEVRGADMLEPFSRHLMYPNTPTHPATTTK